ncbi:MAG TPA: aspartyl/asparaginyl beta-hydroxylase domain-containing protein [Acidimicrobiales bacterium]
MVGERVGQASLEAGAAVLRGFERYVVRSSLVPTTPFLDPGGFAWVAPLEAHWEVIRAELDEVLQRRDDLPNFQDISTDQASITDDDRWKTFFLFGYGFKSEANCARCPRTTALLEQVPGMTTAMFSILSAGKHIEAHRGPYRGVLRYHLGLRIPEPASAAGISVGGEVRHWAEGKSLVFDDGYEHFAWNDTEGLRVVLFMDVIRPLKRPAADLNAALIKAIAVSPFVRDAKRRHLAWEKRFEALGR